MNSDERNSQAPSDSEYESPPIQNDQTENSKANDSPSTTKSKEKTNHSDRSTPDNFSTSSYSTSVDPKPLDMKKWHKLHLSILRGEDRANISDSVVESRSGSVQFRFSSPDGREGASRSEEFRKIPPIVGGTTETAGTSGTFYTTTMHSNNLGSLNVNGEENNRPTGPPSYHSRYVGRYLANMPVGYYGHVVAYPVGAGSVQLQRNCPPLWENIPPTYHRQYFLGYVPVNAASANLRSYDSPRGLARSMDKKNVKVQGRETKVTKGVFTSRTQMSKHLHWKSMYQSSSNYSIAFLEDEPVHRDTPRSTHYNLPDFPASSRTNPPANAIPRRCCQNVRGISCLCFQSGRAEVGNRSHDSPRRSAGSEDTKNVRVQGSREKVAKEILRFRIRASEHLHGKRRDRNSSNSMIAIDYGTL